MASDAFVPVEDLHGGVGQARFHLFFYILVGYGVVHPVQGDVVVELDGRRFPLRHFEGCGGKGLQQGAFLALGDVPPAAFLLLELARVERLQPIPYGFVQFREREKLLVATNRWASMSSPVSGSMTCAGSPAQSTSTVSAGRRGMCMVALRFCSSCWM